MQLLIAIFFLISLVGSSFFLYMGQFSTFSRSFYFDSQVADIKFMQIFNKKNIRGITGELNSYLDPIYNFGLQSKQADGKGGNWLNKKNVSQDSQKLDIQLSVERYQLPNGLTVLLHSDARIPYIYHLLLMKVGSVNEEEGKTGLAHLFEHMMFRGTKRFSDEEYDKKLNAIGALNNAFTSRDTTGYHVYLPQKHLEMVLDMESDRLQNLVITQKIFETELEVVKEERRMSTDNDPGDIFEPMMKLIYPFHSYGRPIIGWMRDLESMTVPNLKQFYQTHYTPNNAVLVLTGDFDIDKTKKLIQKYYGPLRKVTMGKLNTHKQEISNQKKIKRLVNHQRAVQGSTVAFGFRAPSVDGEGSYDLDIVSHILTGGHSGRLKKLLVYEKRLALSVSSFYYGFKEVGIFVIKVRLVPGASAERVKQLVFEELKKLSSQEVSDKELLKSQRSVLHFLISSNKDLTGKARSLGESEIFLGDYKEFFKQLDYYRAVTVKTIQKNIIRYLQRQQVFIVQLAPIQKSTKGSAKAL